MEQDGAAGVEMFASHFSKVNNKLDTLFKDKVRDIVVCNGKELSLKTWKPGVDKS